MNRAGPVGEEQCLEDTALPYQEKTWMRLPLCLGGFTSRAWGKVVIPKISPLLVYAQPMEHLPIQCHKHC